MSDEQTHSVNVVSLDYQPEEKNQVFMIAET
jgi:hypothetical protein